MEEFWTGGRDAAMMRAEQLVVSQTINLPEDEALRERYMRSNINDLQWNEPYKVVVYFDDLDPIIVWGACASYIRYGTGLET